jgi:hypothetical protein
MSARAILMVIALSSMSAGLAGCGGAGVSPAIDLSQIKSPAIRQAAIDELKSRPRPPALPASQRATADWIDRLRLDIEQKAAVGWELVQGVKQCRAPIGKLAAAK